MDRNLPGPSSVKIYDDNYESVVNGWLQELEKLDDSNSNTSIEQKQPDDDIVSDTDDAPYIPSDHESTSELSGDSDTDDFENIAPSETNYFYGKNRFKWSKIAPARNVRTPSHNIIRLPCAKGQFRQEDLLSPCESFQQIFDQQMLDNILTWTNKKLQNIRLKYPNDVSFRECTIIELKGLLALLIYSAAFKSNHESILAIFATDGSGREIFRASMNIRRFCSLLIALRFDDFEDREARKEIDPGCAVTEILELFNKNSQKSYTIGANATVDEMLIAFRGRCKFKMYMPNKPAKYGLKVQCLADARTTYVYNTYLYTGKDSDGKTLSQEDRKKPIPTQAVIRLCTPIFNTNRNVTTDNWYSSMELLSTLKEKGLTTIGTLRKNKGEIPQEFLPQKKRPVGSSLFGFTNQCTIVSYVPKKNKAVILYSSMHHGDETNEVTGKPVIIDDYNNTKGGVDSVDQKCSVYSSSR